MVTDRQVRRLMQLTETGEKLMVAALKTGMDEHRPGFRDILYSPLRFAPHFSFSRRTISLDIMPENFL